MYKVCMLDTIQALQLWYSEHCNDEWAHQYGIRIETLDNPGWSVEIDLTGTSRSGVAFVSTALENSAFDWVRCTVEQQRFKGYGGPENLDQILRTFLEWASD